VLVSAFRWALQAGQPSAGKTRLYVDAKSFLPIAARADSKSRFSTTTGDTQGSSTKVVTLEVHQRSTFEHAFSRTSVLPDDFFAAASISAWAAATPPD
jgi:hypothetical protein